MGYLIYYTKQYLDFKGINEYPRRWLVNSEGDLKDALLKIRDFLYEKIPKGEREITKRGSLLRRIARDPELLEIENDIKI